MNYGEYIMRVRNYYEYDMVRQRNGKRLMRCYDCKHFTSVPNGDPEIEYCHKWHGITSKDGYCHKAERKNENG